MTRTADYIMQRLTSVPILTLLIAAVFGLSACDSVTDNGGDARLRIEMIDAPFPFELVESVDVTITRVEAHSETSGSVTISDESQSFNLLELQNGVSAVLGEVDVEPGTYDQIRVYVEDASITLTDGTTHDLKVPSGRVKVLLNGLTIANGEDVTQTIDFDVSKSFVVQGNPATPAGIKGFIFKPTILPAGVERNGDNDDEDEEESDDD